MRVSSSVFQVFLKSFPLAIMPDREAGVEDLIHHQDDRYGLVDMASSPSECGLRLLCRATTSD